MFGQPEQKRSTLAENLEAFAKLQTPPQTWQMGGNRSFVEEAAIRIASSLVAQHDHLVIRMDQSEVVQRSVAIAKGLAKELGKEQCS